MGQTWSNLMKALFGPMEKRILLLGLDGAGKTQILYRWNNGETIDTMPTIGFNVETINFAGISFTAWDVGGQRKIRNLWTHYFDGVDGLIFVVDSADVARMAPDSKHASATDTDGETEVETAKEELARVLADDRLRNVPVLVMANKQDLPGSLKPIEVAKRMGLTALRAREWYCQGTNAKVGEGLVEGLTWLSNTLRTTKTTKQGANK